MLTSYTEQAVMWVHDAQYVFMDECGSEIYSKIVRYDNTKIVIYLLYNDKESTKEEIIHDCPAPERSLNLFVNFAQQIIVYS